MNDTFLVLIALTIALTIGFYIGKLLFSAQSKAEKASLEEKINAKYHVIAGAYRNEHNADKVLKELVAQGFDAHLLKKNKSSLIPVAFGSFTKLKEAQNLKLKIKAKDSIDAWLLID